MPYINKEDRDWLDNSCPANIPGHLNYMITRLIQDYYNKDKTYGRINDIMGVLECVKQEFYRRIAVPYEDKKIKENGDVY